MRGMCASTHTRKHTHTHAYTLTHTHLPARMHARTHTYTHTHARTHAHTHSRTHTLTHRRTHPHTLTHTYTQVKNVPTHWDTTIHPHHLSICVIPLYISRFSSVIHLMSLIISWGSWRIFGDAPVTIAQCRRARDLTNLSYPQVPGSIPAKNPSTQINLELSQ